MAKRKPAKSAEKRGTVVPDVSEEWVLTIAPQVHEVCSGEAVLTIAPQVHEVCSGEAVLMIAPQVHEVCSGEMFLTIAPPSSMPAVPAVPAKPAKRETRPVACYVRVSSKDQKHDSQRDVIEQWLKGNGIGLDTVGWYSDTSSGRSLSRPAFARLQADIFNGTVKTVIIYKLDRIARRLKDGLDVLCSWTDRGIRVVSVTQQIDMNGALGRMMSAVLMGLSEIEWEYRRDRQRDGIEAARKRGAYRGRQVGTLKASANRARALRDQGLTAGEIGTALGISERTVWRYLDQDGGHPVADGHRTSLRAENGGNPQETGRSASLAGSPVRTDGLTFRESGNAKGSSTR